MALHYFVKYKQSKCAVCSHGNSKTKLSKEKLKTKLAGKIENYEPASCQLADYHKIK